MKLTMLVAAVTFMGALSAQTTSKECIIVQGELKEIQVAYDATTKEKTYEIDGRILKYDNIVSTGQYASETTWYTNNDMIKFKGGSYVKYGLPRVLGVDEISKAGMYKGIGVYIEAGTKGKAEIIYIPVRKGCEFQPYQVEVVPVKSTPKKTGTGKTPAKRTAAKKSK